MLNLRHISETQRFLQIVPWDMELRVSDIHQEKFSSLDCCNHNVNAAAALLQPYLQLLDCQCRAKSLDIVGFNRPKWTFI